MLFCSILHCLLRKVAVGIMQTVKSMLYSGGLILSCSTWIYMISVNKQIDHSCKLVLKSENKKAVFSHACSVHIWKCNLILSSPYSGSTQSATCCLILEWWHLSILLVLWNTTLSPPLVRAYMCPFPVKKWEIKLENKLKLDGWIKIHGNICAC